MVGMGQDRHHGRLEEAKHPLEWDAPPTEGEGTEYPVCEAMLRLVSYEAEAGHRIQERSHIELQKAFDKIQLIVWNW